MRKILFRAKAINRDPDGNYRTSYQNGDWVYGLVSKIWSKYNEAEMTNEDGVSGIEVDYETIGQYTGLDDKNGVPIFEGDIVLKRTHHGKKPYILKPKRSSATTMNKPWRVNLSHHIFYLLSLGE